MIGEIEEMAPRGKLAFSSANELTIAVEKYFIDCAAKRKTVLDRRGVAVDVDCPEIPTISGLAVALGVDRRTVVNYAKRDDYGDIIARARARVEAAMEQHLMTRDGAQGAKFSLSVNYGWTPVDRKEVDVRGAGSLAEALERRQKQIRDELGEGDCRN